MPPTGDRHSVSSDVLDADGFWLTERARQVIDWLRSEEERSAKKRHAERSKEQRQQDGRRRRRGYVERVRAAQGDMELLIWGALRLLILLALCTLACAVIGVVVLVFLAVQQVGPVRAGMVAGGTLSAVTVGGTAAWRSVQQGRGRRSTARDE